MTDTEYLEQRLRIAENTLLMVMQVVMDQMPPHAQQHIIRISLAWDEALDKLNNERKSGGN